MPIPPIIGRFLNNYAIFVILIIIIVILRINATDTQTVIITINVDNATNESIVKDIVTTLDNHSAIFFLTARWAQANEELTKELAQQHEVGCYTANGGRLVHLTGKALENEIIGCKITLENITGQEVFGFRAPKHDVSGKALEMVAQTFAYDSSLYKRYEWFWEPQPNSLTQIPITSFLLIPLDDKYGQDFLQLSDLFYTMIRHTKQEKVVIALDANRMHEHLLDVEYLLATYKHKGARITTIEQELGAE